MKHTGLLGAQGSGKSEIGATKGFSLSIRGAKVPGGYRPIMPNDARAVGLVVMETYTELEDIAVPTYMMVCPKHLLVEEYHSKRKRMRFLNAQGGVETILFRSTDRDHDFHAIIPKWVHIDEAARTPKLVWNILCGRVDRSDPLAQIWATSTPEDENWFIIELCARGLSFEDALDLGIPYHPDPDFKVWWIQYEECDGTRDPKIAYLSQVARLRKLRTLPKAQYQQLYEARPTSYEGRIYKEFDRQVHVFPDFKLPAHFTRRGSVDFGSTEPHHVLWFAISDDNPPIWVVYREVARGGTNTKALGAEILREQGKEDVSPYLCDNVEELIDILCDLGVPAEAARKGPDSKKAGIDRVAGLLHPRTEDFTWPKWLPGPPRSSLPRLIFMESCEITIEQHQRWRWKRANDGESRPEPLDRNDHGCDCVIYGTSDEYLVSSDPLEEEKEGANQHWRDLGALMQGKLSPETAGTGAIQC